MDHIDVDSSPSDWGGEGRLCPIEMPSYHGIAKNERFIAASNLPFEPSLVFARNVIAVTMVRLEKIDWLFADEVG